MSVSPEEVMQVARLARLELSPGERDLFTRELGAILEWVDRLRELDTAGVEPMTAIPPRFNAFREDRIGEPLGVNRSLANAPEAEGGFFRIPRILE